MEITTTNEVITSEDIISTTSSLTSTSEENPTTNTIKTTRTTLDNTDTQAHVSYGIEITTEQFAEAIHEGNILKLHEWCV